MSHDFKSTLLREKFVLHDPANTGTDAPHIALSNRMVVPLQDETFVVRTQNMHSCVRLAAALAREHASHGPMAKKWSFDWKGLWLSTVKDHEKDENPDLWAAVYHKGKIIFEDGVRHPLCDIIEKCDAMHDGIYPDSVQLAEQSFQQANKDITIEYSSNIALIITLNNDEEAKCGLIVRGSNRKTTFNCTVRRRPALEPVHPARVLEACAGFFEGIQLAFHIGMTNRKLELELLQKFSKEDRAGKRSMERLILLDKAIDDLEQTYFVQYRPDRPDFFRIVKEAEDFAGNMLKA